MISSKPDLCGRDNADPQIAYVNVSVAKRRYAWLQRYLKLRVHTCPTWDQNKGPFPPHRPVFIHTLCSRQAQLHLHLHLRQSFAPAVGYNAQASGWHHRQSHF